ncbi:MAG: hypothetical protein EOO87_02865 [Pedobacter sp.]|nr:MAG: hypothetical protein EOO87_02865 [Pedobacter sp.]
MKYKTTRFFILFFVAVAMFSCSSEKKPAEDKPGRKAAIANEDLPANNLKFADVDGILFYEAKRKFSSGLSFNEDGFQQVPSWTIQVKAPDSILAYSPEKNGMEAFYLHHDHGRVYNFAREYFRALVISKDSLILQRLHVDGRSIAGDDDPRSDVNCIFYSKDYIDNKLKKPLADLRKPTKADTGFVQKLVDKSNKEPSNPKTAFPATHPVRFIPNSKNVTVEKVSTADSLNKRRSSVDYFYPLYKIKINKSYKNFSYSFSVVVDANGKMYVNKGTEFVLEEYREQRKKLLQGLADVYLQNLFFVKPGETLGIAHPSEIDIILVGNTGS